MVNIQKQVYDLLIKDIGSIDTEKAFKVFCKKLTDANLPNDVEYNLYNKAFEQLYKHPAFDENGNCF